MRVIFAGTPEFAAVALTALHEAGFTIPLVLTQPDRPAGRGMQLQPSPVKRYALAHCMPVAQPVSLRLDGKHGDDAAATHALLRSTPHDVMVVAAYGLILPVSVLGIAPLGCINIHASLLPRWRGAAPIHRAIEAGDVETGITIMQMDEGLDTGEMLLIEREPIAAEDTTAKLHDRLAAMGGRLMVEALHKLAQGDLSATPQPADGVTYAAKIAKDEAPLDFALPAAALLRRIHAFNPFPGAVAHAGEVALKIWDAQLSTAQGTPGSVLAVDASGITVACGEAALLLTELQKPGGKRLPAAAFLQGFPLSAGQILSGKPPVSP
jgi:methionyl-tRNA formyltransferase